MNNNPPAFPRRASPRDFIDCAFDGMTLRDYFAAKAMEATVARLPLYLLIDTHNLTPDLPRLSAEDGAAVRRATADIAYEYADAMLAERQKGAQ